MFALIYNFSKSIQACFSHVFARQTIFSSGGSIFVIPFIVSRYVLERALREHLTTVFELVDALLHVAWEEGSSYVSVEWFFKGPVNAPVVAFLLTGGIRVSSHGRPPIQQLHLIGNRHRDST